MIDSNDVLVDSTNIDVRRLGIKEEVKLRDWGIPYEFVHDFPVANMVERKETQCRHNYSMTTETVDSYTLQMKEGAVFPPVILMAPNNLLDGVHRIRSTKRLGRKTYPAFIATFATVTQARAFAAACNETGGKRLTSTEALEAAEDFIANGYNNTQIARELGKSSEWVRNVRNKEEYRKRCSNIKELSTTWDKVAHGQRDKLNKSIHNDKPFIAAVTLAAESSSKPYVVDSIVEAIGKSRSDEEAIAAIKDIRDEVIPVAPPPGIKKLPSLPRRILDAERNGRNYVGTFRSNPSLLIHTLPDKIDNSIRIWEDIKYVADNVLRIYRDGQSS